ncbi:hypothetical protein N0V83_009310 [Neocucurbitaria cava]|uniref:Uncharacterized protein n=1 Tax=Neocucurbitaria cava TaxID=798079 RepID=A0A9W8Y0M1_9PLEO|nr:hypothetical protein N0V83_009310 [Neocucurbitaria cava]
MYSEEVREKRHQERNVQTRLLRHRNPAETEELRTLNQAAFGANRKIKVAEDARSKQGRRPNTEERETEDGLRRVVEQYGRRRDEINAATTERLNKEAEQKERERQAKNKEKEEKWKREEADKKRKEAEKQAAKAKKEAEKKRKRDPKSKSRSPGEQDRWGNYVNKVEKGESSRGGQRR